MRPLQFSNAIKFAEACIQYLALKQAELNAVQLLPISQISFELSGVS